MGLTFHGHLIEQLKENCVPNDLIDKIVPFVMNHEAMSSMRDRWMSQIEGYPAGMANLNWALARTVVAEWLAIHAPKAWFRPAFSEAVLHSKDHETAVREFWDNDQKGASSETVASDDVTSTSKREWYASSTTAYYKPRQRGGSFRQRKHRFYAVY